MNNPSQHNSTQPNNHNLIIEDEAALDLPEYIDKPEYITNKKLEYTLQTIGWLISMALLMPIITLLLWIYGIHNIYDYVLVDTGKNTHFNLIYIGFIIIIMASILLSWASYNWFRFRKVERRETPENTPLVRFAASFHCKEQDILDLRQSKNITLHYDDHGFLINFDLHKGNYN